MVAVLEDRCCWLVAGGLAGAAVGRDGALRLGAGPDRRERGIFEDGWNEDLKIEIDDRG